MAKIYRTTDRIAIKLGDVTIKVAPLSLQQKNEVQKLMLEGQKSSDLQKLNDALLLAIKYSLKEMSGVTDVDGNKYELKSDNGVLTDECVDDLMNMEQSPNLLKVCAAFVSGIPTKFDIEGVEILEKKTQLTTV